MPGAILKCHPVLYRQCGVTLVELMIALVIGLLVTVAMLKVYVDASRMYRFNEGLARVQENGRFALEFIRHDARVAGFWGCYSDADLQNSIKATSDVYIKEDEYITGTNDDGLNNADSITFRSATGMGALVTTDMSETDDNITVNSTVGKGKAALISDCENGDVFEVTGNDGAVLKRGADANILSNLRAYAAGARVYKARQTIFLIQDDPYSGVPTLYRKVGDSDPQPLVEGIENMQILYGEDKDETADGTANRYVQWSDNADELNSDRIVSLRISLLVRSIKNNLTTEPVPYIYPPWTNPLTPTTPNAGDRHLRKVFTTTIMLRNKAG